MNPYNNTGVVDLTGDDVLDLTGDDVIDLTRDDDDDNVDNDNGVGRAGDEEEDDEQNMPAPRKRRIIEDEDSKSGGDEGDEEEEMVRPHGNRRNTRRIIDDDDGASEVPLMTPVRPLKDSEMRKVAMTADERREALEIRRYVEARQRAAKVSPRQQLRQDLEDETAFNRQFLTSAGVRLKPSVSARRVAGAMYGVDEQANYDPYQEQAVEDNTPFAFDEGYDKWRDRQWDNREYASTANSVATHLMKQHNRPKSKSRK